AAARKLCERRPDDVRARVRLIELDRAAGRFAEAAEDLAQLAQIVSEERRVDVILERADLLEHKLKDPGAAAEAYKEALALRPGAGCSGPTARSASTRAAPRRWSRRSRRWPRPPAPRRSTDWASCTRTCSARTTRPTTRTPDRSRPRRPRTRRSGASAPRRAA